jgi:hypothetical protein
MADLADVESALANSVVAALYPSGLSQSSIVGVTCRIYRGWPAPTTLNTDLAAGLVNVTVCPTITPDEILPPYLDRLYSSIPISDLEVTTTGQDVILTGIPRSNQTVGLLINGQPFVYNVSGTDAIQNVAANLAAVIGSDHIVVVSGATLSFPDARTLVARVVTGAVVSRELRRQRREILVCCWCPSQALRDAVSKGIDLALTMTPSLDLPDGTRALVRYDYTRIYDQSQNSLLYRRDLSYRCEYTVIGSYPAPLMIFGNIIDNSSNSYV